MKPGKGGDTTEALRKIWMEGYNHARREAGLHEAVRVVITAADLARATEPGHCASPQACPVCRVISAVRGKAAEE
jgi:hypothetical protein